MRSSDTESLSSFINRNAGIIAAVPAFLLCASALVMLILDVLMPSMSEKQYAIYPLMLRMISLAGIICMAACFGARLEKGEPLAGPVNIFFLLFAVWMIISTLINGVSHDAIFSRAFRYVGVYDLMIFIFVYMYCSGCEWKKGLRRVFYIFFLLTADLIALAFFCNAVTGGTAAFNGKLEPSAIFFHGNHYGYFLVMMIAVAACCFIQYEGKTSVTGAASMMTGLAALALNRSMGCILAAGTALMAIFVWSLVRGGAMRRRALIMTAVIVLIVTAALVSVRPLREDVLDTAAEFTQILNGGNNVYAGNGRWGIWQFVAGYIRDYPVWGYGCEGISDVMLDYTLTANPHNEMLTYAAFFGVPAALFYIAGVIMAIIKGLLPGRRTAARVTAAFTALAYFLSSVFGVAMFYTAPFLFVFMGMSSCDEETEAQDPGGKL